MAIIVLSKLAMASKVQTLGRKTRLFTILVVLTNVLGNFLLSHGMRQVGATTSFSVPAYLIVFSNPWVVGGVGLLALWLLAQLSLLSWADLSYVLPVTAVAYVLTALLAHLVGGEPVDTLRWIGILLITAGSMMVGSTTAVSSELRLSGEAL